jgi:hypothetical protein
MSQDQLYLLIFTCPFIAFFLIYGVTEIRGNFIDLKNNNHELLQELQIIKKNPWYGNNKRPISDGVMWKRITEQLDLTVVILKIHEMFPQWDEQRINNAVMEYRKFLHIFGTTIGIVVVPWNTNEGNDDLDQVWHTHILHMKKYIEDCQMLFGEVLYHSPLLEGGEEQHKKNILSTQNAYKRAFQPPRRCPKSISDGYSGSQQSNPCPWVLWWAAYSSTNTDSVAGMKYSSSKHAMYGSAIIAGIDAGDIDADDGDGSGCGSGCGSSCGGSCGGCGGGS